MCGSAERGAKPRWTCMQSSSSALIFLFLLFSLRVLRKVTNCDGACFLFYCIKGHLRPFAFSLTHCRSLDRLVSNLKLDSLSDAFFRRNQGCKRAKVGAPPSKWVRRSNFGFMNFLFFTFQVKNINLNIGLWYLIFIVSCVWRIHVCRAEPLALEIRKIFSTKPVYTFLNIFFSILNPACGAHWGLKHIFFLSLLLFAVAKALIIKPMAGSLEL